MPTVSLFAPIAGVDIKWITSQQTWPRAYSSRALVKLGLNSRDLKLGSGELETRPAKLGSTRELCDVTRKPRLE
jgi:hypothetical protein